MHWHGAIHWGTGDWGEAVLLSVPSTANISSIEGRPQGPPHSHWNSDCLDLMLVVQISTGVDVQQPCYAQKSVRPCSPSQLFRSLHSLFRALNGGGELMWMTHPKLSIHGYTHLALLTSCVSAHSKIMLLYSKLKATPINGHEYKYLEGSLTAWPFSITTVGSLLGHMVSRGMGLQPGTKFFLWSSRSFNQNHDVTIVPVDTPCPGWDHWYFPPLSTFWY